MAELLFILVTIYVAYVVFKVVECEKNLKKQKTATQPATASQPHVTVKTEVTPKPAAAPQPKTASTPKPASPAKPATPAAATKLNPGELKNPETGEISKIASNYRFLKRWIKEALVTEGLLEKIYKNTELDKANIAKINEALNKLKAMDKYQ